MLGDGEWWTPFIRGVVGGLASGALDVVEVANLSRFASGLDTPVKTRFVHNYGVEETYEALSVSSDIALRLGDLRTLIFSAKLRLVWSGCIEVPKSSEAALRSMTGMCCFSWDLTLVCFSVRRTVSSRRCWIKMRAGNSFVMMRLGTSECWCRVSNGAELTLANINVSLEVYRYCLCVAFVIGL